MNEGDWMRLAHDVPFGKAQVLLKSGCGILPPHPRNSRADLRLTPKEKRK
jgi:hypothetical protein